MISISSLPPRGRLAYHDAFFTPGILPCSAMSRNTTLEIPKYRIYPLGRPVNYQRSFSRTPDAFPGH